MSIVGKRMYGYCPSKHHFHTGIALADTPKCWIPDDEWWIELPSPVGFPEEIVANIRRVHNLEGNKE